MLIRKGKCSGCNCIINLSVYTYKNKSYCKRCYDEIENVIL